MYPCQAHMDTRYKTVFASQIRAIEPSEETRNEAKASLSQLRNLLPANINPEDEPALLFVAGNLAVGGYVNLNDDGVDIPTALSIYKKFERQQINLEHDRKAVVGYIVHAGLSELGTDRVITEEEARSADKPFNISVIIALWRAVNKSLCQYIEQASSPTHPDFNSLSLSFEVGFEEYRVVALPKDTPDIARASLIVKPDEDAFGRYSAALRANKGSGLAPGDSNLRVFRIIDGGIIPLGGGIVTVPAAAVRGLIAIKPVETEEPEESDESEENEEHEKREQEAREMAAALESAKNVVTTFIECAAKKMPSIIKPSEISVSPNTSLTFIDMKPADIQALKERASKATEVKELTEVVASATGIIDAIVAESERQEAARKEAESHSAKIEEAKQQAVAAAEQLKKDLDAVKAELDTIKQAQATADAEKTFNERMTAIDSTFELNDDERQEIVSDVRDLSTEAFAKWMDKSKKLMKEKMKEHKKKMADEAKASQDALLVKLNEKGVKAKLSDAGIEIEEIIASAKDNIVSSDVHNLINADNPADIKALAKEALKGMKFPGAKE